MVVNGQAATALNAELAAMQHIAAVLDSLDPSTRARVLHWAAQRIEDAAPVAPPAAALRSLSVVRPQAVPETPSVDDDTLSVTTLEDLFDQAPGGGSGTPAAEPAPQPVAGLLHDFVVEFQSIARDWNAACDEPADRPADQRASSAA